MNVLTVLALQVRWLSKKIEWHILGNHLFANAKALVFAGLFFQGREANAWLAKGLRILSNEIPEQILPDGEHFERSPMYQTIILEDLLDLINLSNAFPDNLIVDFTKDLKSTATKMLNWLIAMCHQDGEISFFNDASIGLKTITDGGEIICLPSRN